MGSQHFGGRVIGEILRFAAACDAGFVLRGFDHDHFHQAADRGTDFIKVIHHNLLRQLCLSDRVGFF